MSEMVERVAKALADIEADIDADMFHYHYESRRDSYNALARAAIEAMRQPTDEMVNSCGNGECSRWAPGAWKNYIDAALGDER